ncbi:MAG: ribosome biogenesis GTPase Der [Gammaproteobacteria bacterium]|nr:ribosome biogenesis GTPase Der [Gammaproteobacteria bacterium]
MLSVVAIIGRPNVGKSTVFNCLTASNQALVADEPGVTRDRLYGYSEIDGRQFAFIDTGGLFADPSKVCESVTSQAWLAVAESDLVLFVVDAHSGLHPLDQQVAKQLYTLDKPVLLVVNKSDGMEENLAASDFHQLGFSLLATIAALHRRGIRKLINQIGELLPPDSGSAPLPNSGIGIAIIGRPNVGKSTLINSLLGEERVITHNMAGTTRDAISVPFQYQGEDLTLIDTAGVRRRGKVKVELEQGAVVRTLRSIHAAHVVVMMVDGSDDLSEQDLKLLSLVLKAGRSLIIAVNKWDMPSTYERSEVERSLDRRLTFVPFAEIHFISALHGQGIDKLLQSAMACYRAASQELRSSQVTRLLEHLVEKHSPPLVHGRRIRLRYAHPGGHYPLTIVIHGKQVDKLPLSYCRYLENGFRKALKLIGTPVKLRFKTDSNPFDKKS